jgi:hypothetical protein
MFSPLSVCLSVCLSGRKILFAKYLKKLWTDFDETFRDDCSRARDQSIRFWERSVCFCGSRIILKVSLPLRDRAKSRTAQLGGGMRSTECPLVIYCVCLFLVLSSWRIQFTILLLIQNVYGVFLCLILFYHLLYANILCSPGLITFELLFRASNAMLMHVARLCCSSLDFRSSNFRRNYDWIRLFLHPSLYVCLFVTKCVSTKSSRRKLMTPVTDILP